MKYIVFIWVLALPVVGSAQEFFPSSRSANTVAGGVITAELSNEFYKDLTQPRFWQGYNFIYGINGKLEIDLEYSFSNHHGYILPQNYITKDGSDLYTTGYVRGSAYPFTFDNFAVSARYRFLSFDGEQQHFRMTGVVQLAGGNEPHMVAETDLTGDNSGAYTALITTYLKHKFAFSLTAGLLIPHEYFQADSNIALHYGSAITYSLSAGYLLLPHTYSSYKQVNVNLYLECVGESYQPMQSITKEGETVLWKNVASLNGGYYAELRPAIEFIFNSNTRVDIAVACLAAGNSYERNYPIYFLNIVHNFYL